MKPQVFPERDINSSGKRYVVDCSPAGGPVNHDQYFFFDRKADAKNFAAMIEQGVSSRDALHAIYPQ